VIQLSYKKQNFVEDQILTADHLNHIEDGIETISNGLSGLSSSSSALYYSGSNYDSGGSRVSLGCNNTVTGTISIGLGQENQVTGSNSLGLGRDNVCTTHNTFMIGLENEVVYSNDSEWAYSFLFGERNRLGFKEGESAGNLSTDAEAAYGSVALGQYNQVGYKCAVMGDSNRAKDYGYAIGANCNACNYSLAIGTYCNALDKKTVSVGHGSYAGGGSYASSFGYASRAEANCTLAMGYNSYARKARAIAVGGNAAEEESLAVGYYSNAYSKCSAALTPYTYATGENAVCIGYGAETYAKNAIAIGYATKVGETGEGVTAMGHFNDSAVTGCSTGTTGTALVIGNGTSNNARSNACRITFAGAVIGKAAYQSSGADYAEYFEWLDGNTDSEDRRGYFVTMDGNKIKKAKEGDYILGIVSAYPAVIGNNDMEWSGKFLLDEFGNPIKKVQKTIIKEHELNKDVHFTDEEMQTLTDEERKQREMKEVEKEVECEYFVLNPDFDPDREYVHRADRPEWDTVGMMGVLAVYDDGTCEVNGFCKCNNEGIATACEKGCDSYRVIKRVNENIVQIVFR
jgi:hypothetical protein